MRFSSYSVPTALALAVLVASVMDANALTILDDGGTHTIDASNSIPGMGVDVMDGPDGPTTLNVVAGGNIGVDTDGFFGNFSVLLRGSSVANITGGGLLDDLQTTDSAVANVSGGAIASMDAGGGSSIINVTGGVITGSMDPNGGTINLSGGFVGETDAFNGGVLNIFGSGFNFPLGVISDETGTITGTLADGSALSLSFAQDPASTITLIPEPSPAFLLASGLVAMAVARRRRAL